MIAEARSPDKLPGLPTFYNSQSSPAPRRSHPEPAAAERSKIPALPEGLSQAGSSLRQISFGLGMAATTAGGLNTLRRGGRERLRPFTAAGLANPFQWGGALPQRSRSGTISASSPKNEQSAHATRHTRAGGSPRRFLAAHPELVGGGKSRAPRI